MRPIDADALKAKYEQMIPDIGDGYHKETLQDVLFELEHAPTISPDEVRGVGKWVGEYDGYYDGEPVWDMWSCSECGEFFDEWDDKPTWNYCPNCGAKMEVSEDADT